MKKMLLAVAAAGLVVLAASCSSGTPSGSNTPITPAGGDSVSITNYDFAPSKLTVAKGTTVTWTNKDNVIHTVTSADLIFNSRNLAHGASFQYTFNATGNYDYTCTQHTYMSGTITVQ